MRRCRCGWRAIHDGLVLLFAEHRPDEAAVEETYVNRNGTATLKLGYARGVALLAPALAGIPVLEYGALAVKKAVVGTGGASKEQVAMMVRRLLPGAVLRRAMRLTRWRWRFAMRITGPADCACWPGCRWRDGRGVKVWAAERPAGHGRGQAGMIALLTGGWRRWRMGGA